MLILGNKQKQISILYYGLKIERLDSCLACADSCNDVMESKKVASSARHIRSMPTTTMNPSWPFNLGLNLCEVLLGQVYLPSQASAVWSFGFSPLVNTPLGANELRRKEHTNRENRRAMTKGK